MRLLSLPEMSLCGAVLIAAALLLRAAFLNRLPKRTFSALWELAVLRLLLPFSVASALSLYAIFPQTQPEPAVSFTPPSAPVTMTADTPAAPEPLPKSAAPAVITEPTATAEPENGISPETVLRLIRYGGTGLLLLVFAAVYLRGRTEFRMSLPVENDFVEAWRKSCPLRRKVTVRRSDRISAPLTYGVLRPVILLPDPIGEDEKTLGHILTHELVHIRRFDAVKKPLCVLAVCLHWFNPLVWIMFFYFTRDLELACDECAVRELGIGFKSDYAKTLIGMEARKSGLFPFFSHFAGFAAEERIKAIMKLKKRSVAASVAALALVGTAAGTLMTSAETNVPKENTADAENRDELSIVSEKPADPTSETEWWTAEEFEEWLREEQAQLESLIGTGSGWYDKEGNFQPTTRESVDEALAMYRAMLEEIRRGARISKFDESGEVIALTLPTEALRTEVRDKLEPYFPFGVSIRYDERDAEYDIYYQGKEVRALFDETAGVYITNHLGLWDYGEDAADLYAVYENGVLTGLREATEEEYKAATAARKESTQTVILEQESEAVRTEEKLEALRREEEARAALIAEREEQLEALHREKEARAARIAEQEEQLDALRKEEEAVQNDRLLAEYEPFGLTRDENGRLYFHGKRVRIFFDGADLLDETAMITRWSYLDENGEIDVRTLWAPKENGDGSTDPFGILLGLEETKLNPNDFRPSLEAEATAAEGSSDVSGETVAERFAKYRNFGITYNEETQDVFLNGKLVGTFADISEKGTFSFQSKNTGGKNAVDVRTVYENGTLAGVREMTRAEKNAELSEHSAALLGGTYSMSADFGEYNGHRGIDFSAEAGTEIYAFADGIVLEAGFDAERGSYLLIGHENGFCSLYAHCRELYARAGETVEKGAVIAAVGSTGQATGNHLHFELQKNGTPVDPKPYLNPAS